MNHPLIESEPAHNGRIFRPPAHPRMPVLVRDEGRRPRRVAAVLAALLLPEVTAQSSGDCRQSKVVHRARRKDGTHHALGRRLVLLARFALSPRPSSGRGMHNIPQRIAASFVGHDFGGRAVGMGEVAGATALYRRRSRRSGGDESRLLLPDGQVASLREVRERKVVARKAGEMNHRFFLSGCRRSTYSRIAFSTMYEMVRSSSAAICSIVRSRDGDRRAPMGTFFSDPGIDLLGIRKIVNASVSKMEVIT